VEVEDAVEEEEDVAVEEDEVVDVEEGGARVDRGSRRGSSFVGFSSSSRVVFSPTGVLCHSSEVKRAAKGHFLACCCLLSFRAQSRETRCVLSVTRRCSPT
jgi:hypothetical protein